MRRRAIAALLAAAFLLGSCASQNEVSETESSDRNDEAIQKTEEPETGNAGTKNTGSEEAPKEN